MKAQLSNASSSDVVHLLAAAATHGPSTRPVQVIETHISWIFLTDRWAYKLKKPVRYEFLDFSSVEARHQACQHEVRLNRRLAPDVYRAVVPITQDDDGALELDGDGEPVDWVVQMRRLPEEQTLAKRLRSGNLSSAAVDALAHRLAEFYTGLAPAAVAADEYRQALDRHIRANGAVLLSAASVNPVQARRVQSALLRYVHVQAGLLADRVAAGRVVEGHGDLRPEHIYLNGTPIVVDCIEFSAELRTVDIADDLSFLAMECERAGNREIGERLTKICARACGNGVPDSLLDFYRGYRACVRAKVAVLRIQQGALASPADDQLLRQYLELAAQHAGKLGPPLLLFVGGPMGSGKSTLANALASRFGVPLISTDQVRRDRLGPSATPAAYGADLYDSQTRYRIYDEVIRQASRLLGRGESVVLDGTFLRAAWRQRAYDLAERYGALSRGVLCTCPPAVARARITRRGASGPSESEARSELFDQQLHEFEWPTAQEPVFEVDTQQPTDQQFRAVCEALRDALFTGADSQIEPRSSRSVDSANLVKPSDFGDSGHAARTLHATHKAKRPT